MHTFITKAILSFVTLWGMSMITCAARGLEILPVSLANLTKRAGDIQIYVSPRFLMIDPESTEFMGRDLNEPLDYLWSGAISFEGDGSKYQRCLRYISSETFPTHAPCKCTQINKSKGCDDKSINHPTPSYRWAFDGSVRMFKRETRKISFWSGTIRHHASGKCLGYSPDSGFPTYRGDESHTPGKLGDLEMVDCEDTEDETYHGVRIWVVWLTEKDTKTSIIPWGATHMWPACSNTRVKAKKTIMDRLKGKKVRWERVYRGIATSPSSNGVYFGCAREQHTWVTPHPWFYRVPKPRAFFPDKKNNDDMGSAINGEKNSIESLIDFDWPNTTPGNEAPGDLEVEGTPREEVIRTLRGIQYEHEPGIEFDGGAAPAFDDEITSIERENALRQKENIERGRKMRKEEGNSDEEEDDDVFEDAPETWDDEKNAFSDDEDEEGFPEDKGGGKDPSSGDKPVKDPPSNDKPAKNDPPSNNKPAKDPPSGDDKNKDTPDDPFGDDKNIDDPFADNNRVKNDKTTKDPPIK
ncbi:hypothetical protein TWF679_008761 [Orbilia oligospora]|uniref:Uncharacterized protein n=1 Tax=Orbilia oligospora TaxID=2813651 RepID=A0A8H8V4B2_ORBOL|nr:hypothetical protein TWF679_008761 [Orbilia oligospora]